MPNDTLTRVVDCLAATTRYPKQLLTADADIENGLGIDSVKFVEIIIALSEEFGLDLQNEQRDPSIRTIGQLAEWIDRFSQAIEPEQPVASTPKDPVPTTNGEARTHSAHQNGAAFVPAPHYDANGSEGAKGSDFNGVERNGRQPVNSPTNSKEEKSLAGRVALVTGSGRGVGKTIARVLAERGATVLVNSFHSREQGEQTVAEIQAIGGKATHLWGSVANPDHVEDLFKQIEEEHGLDILVCNASDGRIGSFMDLTFDDWDRAFRTNVAGHHRCAVHAARLMRARGGGSIVTLSAVGAHEYIDGLGAQGVAKAAVESLTRYLACELGRYGIRVNCIAGGPVYGDLLSKFPDARVTQDYWESITPDGQLCSPVDLAQTIAFLVSDAARGVNGAVWMVDHGFSANADGQRRHRVSREAVLAPVT